MTAAEDRLPVIEARHLTKRYGRTVAIANLSLAVEPGEIFGLIGPNGAGKSTTIRLLLGFLRPSSGSARVLGCDAWSESTAIKRSVGFLPDAVALYEGMTGRDLLDYLARLHGGVSASHVAQLCERLELAQRDLRRRIKGYSRGMRQKLGIVQAFQHEPALLILDEPTEGLDPLMRGALFGLLEEERGRGGTVFMSSHVLGEVERLCHRVGIVRAGELVVVEAVEELRQRLMRVMVIETRQPVDRTALERIPGVVRVETEGGRHRLFIQGEVNPAVRAVALLDLEDLTIEKVGLEEIFLAYYCRGAEAPTDAA